MKITLVILFAIVLTASTYVCAQDRFEISGMYSYLHFDPTVTGSGALNFNGGGGGIALNFLALFAIKAEYIRYASTTFTKTYSVAVPLPGGGTVPPGTYTAQGNMYTALAGPEIRIPIPKVKPFGEALFGISGTNGYTNVNKTISAAAGQPLRTLDQKPFTLVVGGGVDISISRRLSIRPVEADYVLTLFNNPLTRTNQQNNFRYCGGLVLKF